MLHDVHVFVSDPTQGYGLYIDWMLQESDQMQPEERGSSGFFSVPVL